MKVLLINGSPRKEGCTYTALKEVADTLESCGIETRMLHVGTAPVSGCLACGGCAVSRRCVLEADGVNEAAALMAECDGLIVGSPVHYAAAGGTITAFLDRLFYSCDKNALRGKPAACVVSARRGGTTAAFDQLIKYFTISSMPVVSSQYWNQVHGSCPEEVRQDLEGMQIMRTLGRNMAWLLRCIEAGKQAGIGFPEPEPFARTNFIR